VPVFASGHIRFQFERALTAMLDVLRRAETSVDEVVIVVDGGKADEARRLFSAS